MKVLVIPDVHGNERVLENAKKVYEEGRADKVIFLGDYCDSHDTFNTWSDQKRELEKIMEWKHAVNLVNPHTVDTLFGNHDLSYMGNYGGRSCSQYQHFSAKDIQDTLTNMFEEFEPFVIVDKWLFSHAGVTQEWLNDPMHASVFFPELTNSSLDKIKEIFHNHNLTVFNFNGDDPYGDDSYETCMWIRPPSLIRFGIAGYNQCVGHTALDENMMEYWNLESRIVKAKDWWDNKKFYKYQYEEGNEPDNLDCTYVFLDSPEQEYYAIIDTETNDVKIINY